MTTNESGSGIKFLDWAVVIYALVLFAKTADVLSYFAPTNLNVILGYDVSIMYGMVNAFLVEGVALALHFSSRAALSSTAQIAKWTFLGISAACQVFDGYITTGTVAQMSDTLRFILQVGVPLIPLFGLLLLFAIGQLPQAPVSRRPFVGVRHMFKPTFDKFWNGEENPTKGKKS